MYIQKQSVHGWSVRLKHHNNSFLVNVFSPNGGFFSFSFRSLSTSKGFFNSAPVSDIVPKLNIPDPMNIDFSLKINNTIKQFSNTSLMIINIYKLISYLSTIFGLAKGDLIFTGTPEGVGQLRDGDELLASLSDKVELKVRFNG